MPQRQKAEIEMLEAENTELDKANVLLTLALHNAQAEAIKEFAERLKNEMLGKYCMHFDGEITNAIVDNLVKEMVGEDKWQTIKSLQGFFKMPKSRLEKKRWSGLQIVQKALSGISLTRKIKYGKIVYMDGKLSVCTIFLFGGTEMELKIEYLPIKALKP